MAVMAWSPLAVGVLAGRYNRPDDTSPRVSPAAQRQFLKERNLKIAADLKGFAKQSGHPMAQISLNWLRQSKRANVMPIIGPTTMKHVEQNVGCVDWDLLPEQIDLLDKLTDIELGFPYSWAKDPFLHKLLFGDTEKKIVFPRPRA